jgi:hypothetical protein
MRTASPSLRSSPRQAVVRASFRLAPSLATRPCNLPADKTLDASNRRLPPNRTACTPYLVRSRPAVATFAAWAPHGVLGSVWHCRGKGRFTSPSTASVDRSGHHPAPICFSGRPRLSIGHLAVIVFAASVGVVFPRCLEFFDRASDTPVASPSSAEYRVGFPTLRLGAFAPSLAPS